MPSATGIGVEDAPEATIAPFTRMLAPAVAVGVSCTLLLRVGTATVYTSVPDAKLGLSVPPPTVRDTSAATEGGALVHAP
jgi:hypothetical protein